MDRGLRSEIDELLLNCIIFGGLPYNHFQNSWFQKLFDRLHPGYTIPNRRTIAIRIRQRYSNFVVELKRYLPKDRPIAYTTDTWKSPSRDNFICLTGHVFNDKMQPISLLLSFRRLADRKLSKNLNQYLQYEIRKFGLASCSNAGITTDGGSDIKAATASGEFGCRFPCIAHLLNLIVNHGLSIWNQPKAKT